MQTLRDLLEESPRDTFNLQTEYDRLNRLIFKGKLGKYPMKWTTKKKVAGLVKANAYSLNGIYTDVNIKGIYISRVYERARDHLLGILVHEMIHVNELEHLEGKIKKLYRSHGIEFLNMRTKINNMNLGIKVPITDQVTDLTISSDITIPLRILIVIMPFKGSKQYLLPINPSFFKSPDNRTRINDFVRRAVQLSKGDVKVWKVTSTNTKTMMYKVARKKLSAYHIDSKLAKELIATGDIQDQYTTDLWKRGIVS